MTLRAAWRKVNIPHEFSMETQLQSWLDVLVLSPYVSLKMWPKHTQSHTLCSKMKPWSSNTFPRSSETLLTPSGSLHLPGGTETLTTRAMGFPVTSHAVPMHHTFWLLLLHGSAASISMALPGPPQPAHLHLIWHWKKSHFDNFLQSEVFKTSRERGCNSYESNRSHCGRRGTKSAGWVLNTKKMYVALRVLATGRNEGCSSTHLCCCPHSGKIKKKL